MALAEAVVDIVANTSPFERGLDSKLRKAGANAGKSFTQAFEREVNKSGSRVKIDPDKGGGLARSGDRAGKSWSQSFARSLGSASPSDLISYRAT